MINKLNIGQKYIIKTKSEQLSGIFRGTKPNCHCEICKKTDVVAYCFRVGTILDNLYRIDDMYFCENCFDIVREKC